MRYRTNLSDSLAHLQEATVPDVVEGEVVEDLGESATVTFKVQGRQVTVEKLKSELEF